VSQVTVNGAPAIWGELRLPRVGAWDGDFGVLAREAGELEDAVEIAIGALTWRGAVVRSGTDGGVLQVRVVGGAGRLGSPVVPKAYQGVPLRIPVEDLLTEIGERLSPTSDATTLGTVLPNWSRTAQPAGVALAALLEGLSVAWRVLADGSVWIGPETWPTSALTDYVFVGETPAAGVIEVFSAEPRIFPGEIFRERRVSLVTHRFVGAVLRTRVMWEEEGALLDRLKAGLGAYVRSLFSRLDHYAGYWCRVVAQNADGTLELVPDDPRLHSHSNVPIRYGLPGVQATVASGARVLLEFAGGDPSKPFATVWESATATEIVIAGGTKGAARIDDTAKADTAMATWMSQVETALNALSPGAVTPLSTVPVTGAATVFGVITGGSTKLKVG
jgi:hypothetical protein